MKYRPAVTAIAAFLILLGLAAGYATAEVIRLKDGTKIEGEIVAKNEKQVVVKVGDEFKTIERADIESIEENKPQDKEVEPGREAVDAEKKKKAEEAARAKERTAVIRLYNKWQRTREALVCTKCKGDGKLTCKLCGGDGFRRSLSVGGGQGKVRCRDCMGKGKFDCKTCKTTGRNLAKIRILFWDILDPAYKERAGIASDKQGAVEKGIATSKGGSGFTVSFDTSKLTKKFNLVKDLKYDIKDDYAAVTWECIIGDVSWTEGIVFHKVKKKWYWLPDMAPDEIPDAK
ncbi:MAG: DnaJ-like cysteine-rich domain-containing protein [Planctomycetota bacterium]|jgi:hypothetical protein